MPSHQEVMDFSNKVAEALGYCIADSSESSRVVLLSKDGKKNDIF